LWIGEYLAQHPATPLWPPAARFFILGLQNLAPRGKIRAFYISDCEAAA